MFRRSASLVIAACAAILGVALATVPAVAAPDASPLGNWSTENGHGVVSIAQCGDALCGRIVGIDRDPGDPMPLAMNGQPQCGFTIITNERPDSDGTWLGDITDPRSGSTYHAKLWVDEAGDLHLRGFIGIPLLGRTQIWHPFTGRVTPECELA